MPSVKTEDVTLLDRLSVLEERLSDACEDIKYLQRARNAPQLGFVMEGPLDLWIIDKGDGRYQFATDKQGNPLLPFTKLRGSVNYFGRYSDRTQAEVLLSCGNDLTVTLKGSYPIISSLILKLEERGDAARGALVAIDLLNAPNILSFA